MLHGGDMEEVTNFGHLSSRGKELDIKYCLVEMRKSPEHSSNAMM